MELIGYSTPQQVAKRKSLPNFCKLGVPSGAAGEKESPFANLKLSNNSEYRDTSLIRTDREKNKPVLQEEGTNSGDEAAPTDKTNVSEDASASEDLVCLPHSFVI